MISFERVLALQLKAWYVTRRSFDRLSDLVLWPILDLLLWGFLARSVDFADLPLQAFLLGGLILWVFLWRANNDISLFILEDFWSRNLYGLFASPMHNAEFLLALVLSGLVRVLLTFSLTAVAAFLLYHFSILTFGWLPLAIGGAILVLFGWAVGIAISSLFFRFGDRVQIFSWGITLFLQPFSCVFYPLSALPGWAKAIAVLLPSTHVFEAMRTVIADQPIPWGKFGIAFGESFALLLIAVWLFGLGIKKAKQTGLLTKY